MGEFVHWCGNCQIRVYIQRHYGRDLTWNDCPYTCEYAAAMRCSVEMPNCVCETIEDAPIIIPAEEDI